MRHLRNLHSDILGKVGNVQNQTARILQGMAGPRLHQNPQVTRDVVML